MEIKPPRVGDVIRYNFLWPDEAARGQEQGRKDRPSVIVAAVEQAEDAMVVIVLPITHNAPKSYVEAVEIPAVVARRLGLDEGRQFISCTSANWFIWPGNDLQPIPRRTPAAYVYGVMSGKILRAARERFLDLKRRGMAQLKQRDR